MPSIVTRTEVAPCNSVLRGYVVETTLKGGCHVDRQSGSSNRSSGARVCGVRHGRVPGRVSAAAFRLCPARHRHRGFADAAEHPSTDARPARAHHDSGPSASDPTSAGLCERCTGGEAAGRLFPLEKSSGGARCSKCPRPLRHSTSRSHERRTPRRRFLSVTPTKERGPHVPHNSPSPPFDRRRTRRARDGTAIRSRTQNETNTGCGGLGDPFGRGSRWNRPDVLAPVAAESDPMVSALPAWHPLRPEARGRRSHD